MFVLADDDRAGELQLLDDFGVFGGNAVAVLIAAGGSAHAGGVDVVLERDGDAVQRATVVAGGDFFFGLLRLLEGKLGSDGDEGVERWD